MSLEIQHPRLKGLIFVALCALPGIGSTLLWLRGVSLIPLAAYGLMSLVVIAIVIFMSIWFGRFFKRHMDEDAAAAAKVKIDRIIVPQRFINHKLRTATCAIPWACARPSTRWRECSTRWALAVDCRVSFTLVTRQYTARPAACWVTMPW